MYTNYYLNVGQAPPQNTVMVPFYGDKRFYFLLLSAASVTIGLALLSRLLLGKKRNIVKYVGVAGSIVLGIAGFYATKFGGELISETLAPKERVING